MASASSANSTSIPANVTSAPRASPTSAREGESTTSIASTSSTSTSTSSSSSVPCGSFELNPPFSIELYDALIHRCHSLLERAEAGGAALSYALIIGATQPTLQEPCIRALATSSFLRGTLHVNVADHVYVCGRQHTKPADATFRACDTGVYFLQSSAAAAKWPVTDANLAKLQAAFHATNANR